MITSENRCPHCGETLAFDFIQHALCPGKPDYVMLCCTNISCENPDSHMSARTVKEYWRTHDKPMMLANGGAK